MDGWMDGWMDDNTNPVHDLEGLQVGSFSVEEFCRRFVASSSPSSHPHHPATHTIQASTPSLLHPPINSQHHNHSNLPKSQPKSSSDTQNPLKNPQKPPKPTIDDFLVFAVLGIHAFKVLFVDGGGKGW